MSIDFLTREFDIIFNESSAQFLKSDPIRATFSYAYQMNPHEMYKFIKYVQREYPKLAIQPLLNQLCRLGRGDMIRQYFNAYHIWSKPNLLQAGILAVIHNHQHVIEIILEQEEYYRKYYLSASDITQILILTAFNVSNYSLAEFLIQDYENNETRGKKTGHLMLFCMACERGALFLVERMLKHWPQLHDPSLLAEGYLVALMGGHQHVVSHLVNIANDNDTDNKNLLVNYVYPDEILSATAIGQPTTKQITELIEYQSNHQGPPIARWIQYLSYGMLVCFVVLFIYINCWSGDQGTQDSVHLSDIQSYVQNRGITSPIPSTY